MEMRQHCTPVSEEAKEPYFGVTYWLTDWQQLWGLGDLVHTPGPVYTAQIGTIHDGQQEGGNFILFLKTIYKLTQNLNELWLQTH